ncbi:hypothetical protein D3C84_928670 [compost metagenome]
MMIPIYDCKLSVEPVIVSINKAPKTTAGTVVKITRETLNDWKLAASIKKITNTATNNPVCKLLNVSVSTVLSPIGVINKPRGNSPKELIVLLTSFEAVPKSV